MSHETPDEFPACTCGSSIPSSARYGHAHLSWCAVVGPAASPPAADTGSLLEIEQEMRDTIEAVGETGNYDYTRAARRQLVAWADRLAAIKKTLARVSGQPVGEGQK